MAACINWALGGQAMMGYAVGIFIYRFIFSLARVQRFWGLLARVPRGAEAELALECLDVSVDASVSSSRFCWAGAPVGLPSSGLRHLQQHTPTSEPMMTKVTNILPTRRKGR